MGFNLYLSGKKIKYFAGASTVSDVQTEILESLVSGTSNFHTFENVCVNSANIRWMFFTEFLS